jgi:hypothetical protein
VDGGGQERGFLPAVEDEEDEKFDDFLLDSLCACVEHDQGLMAELEVVSAWRETAGNERTTVSSWSAIWLCFRRLTERRKGTQWWWRRRKGGERLGFDLDFGGENKIKRKEWLKW